MDQQDQDKVGTEQKAGKGDGAGSRSAGRLPDAKRGSGELDLSAPKESLQHQLSISKTTLLEDTASVSQSLFGNFLQKTEGPKLVLLRANSVVEAYALKNGTMSLIATYRATGFKISRIIKVRKPAPRLGAVGDANGHKDMVVVQILPLKFVTLEIDEDVNEFRIVCIHNLSNDVRLQESGKLNSARQGFLQSFCLQRRISSEQCQNQQDYPSTQNKPEKGRPRKASQQAADVQAILDEAKADVETISGFVYLADGCKLVIVQFKHEMEAEEADAQVDCQPLASPEQKQAAQSELSADYLDVYVTDGKGSSARQDGRKAERLLYPTQIVDINRLRSFPNPIAQYLEQIKSDLTQSRSHDDPLSQENLKFNESWSKEARDLPFSKHQANIDYVFHRDLHSADKLANEEKQPQTFVQSPDAQGQQQLLQHSSMYKAETRVVSVRDLKVIEPQGAQRQQDDEVFINIFVLHQVHLEKCTGTDGKPPSFNLNIYEVDLFSLTGKNTVRHKQHEYDKIRLTHCIQRLNHYTRLVVPQVNAFDMMPNGSMLHEQSQQVPPEDDQQESYSQAELLKTDLLYIVSNVSIYAFRQERNTLTEVLTSSLAKVVQNLVEKARNTRERTLDKEMPAPVEFTTLKTDESVANPSVQGIGPQVSAINNQASSTIKALTVQNTIDKSELEIRLDGCTRFHALPNNRLLVLMENQDKWIVHFRFDQADLDVAAVDFVKIDLKIELNHHIVPSCIAVQLHESHSSDLCFRTNRNCQSFLVSVSSYYNDQQVFVLRPVFDSIVQEEQPPEKKQITADGPQALAAEQTASQQANEQDASSIAQAQQIPQQTHKDIRKRAVKNPIPESYTLEQIESLTTLTPITGILQLSQSDLLISSGSQQSAMLTLIRDFKHSALAIKAQQLLPAPGIEEVFSLIFAGSASQPVAQFIILAMENGTTRLTEYSSGGVLKEIDETQNNFIIDQKSLSVQKASTRSQEHFVFQVTATQAKSLAFQPDAKMFKTVADLDIGSTNGRIVQALEIKASEIDDMTDQRDLYLVIEDADGKRSLAAFDFETLTVKETVFECVKDVRVHLACSCGADEVAVVTEDFAFLLLRRQPDRGRFLVALRTNSNLLNIQAAILVDEQQVGRQSSSYQPSNTSSTDFASSIQEDVQKNVQRNWQFKQKFMKTAQRLGILDLFVQSIGTKQFLYILLENGRVIIYERVPIGFKIYKSSFLERLQVNLIDKQEAHGSGSRLKTYRKCFYGEQSQVFAMLQKATGPGAQTCCLVATYRGGRLLFNTLKDSEFAGISSHARILGKVRHGGPSLSQLPSQYFICVIPDAVSKKTNLCMAIHATGHAFDPRFPANPISSGVCLKQFPLKGRGVKCMCIHKGQYLVVATFQKVHTLNAPRNGAIRQGFSPNLGNLAQDYKYGIEVYELPQFYQQSEDGGQQAKQKQNWKELQKFQNIVQEFKLERADEIISSMESVKLNVKLQAPQAKMQSQLPADFKETDDFLLVSTITLESKLDKALYPSCLYVFQINETTAQVPGNHGNQHMQKKASLVLLDQMQSKRLISCLKAYRGHLISVQNAKTDFQIVLQSMQVKLDDGQQSQSMHDQPANTSSELTQTQGGLKYFIDHNAQTQFPNSIQNMARYIGVELDDYIIIGDIYKSFQIFKRKNAQELEKDRITDKSHISLKMRFQSRIDANCIGVYCFGMNQAIDGEEMKKLLEVDLTCDLKQTSLFSASLDGTIRVHEVGGQKALECTAQVNVMDNILRVLPIRPESAKNMQRRFLLVPRHGGLLEVKQCSIEYQKTVQMIQMEVSQLLPFAFGVTPAMCMPVSKSPRGVEQTQHDALPAGFQLATKHLGIPPCNTVLQFTRSIRAQYETMERIEQSGTLSSSQFSLSRAKSTGGVHSSMMLSESKIVDARLVVNEFLSLSHDIQEYVAMRIGFQSLQELWAIIERQ